MRPLERPQISSNDPNFVGCGISLILDDGAYLCIPYEAHSTALSVKSLDRMTVN